ncbi:hypothetical protein BpHYR1_051900 [Brachionus plicatilis]|uniref:Uncharacterized protein n=1 Tax=Brachionus plicatilis TaxID=10195 RepID=A0A3M7RMC8_BRAPC|nr:hypothetical protein BpHYR1_051900 [Brachionus plicatilis]
MTMPFNLFIFLIFTVTNIRVIVNFKKNSILSVTNKIEVVLPIINKRIKTCHLEKSLRYSWIIDFIILNLIIKSQQCFEIIFVQFIMDLGLVFTVLNSNKANCKKFGQQMKFSTRNGVKMQKAFRESGVIQVVAHLDRFKHVIFCDLIGHDFSQFKFAIFQEYIDEDDEEDVDIESLFGSLNDSESEKDPIESIDLDDEEEDSEYFTLTNTESSTFKENNETILSDEEINDELEESFEQINGPGILMTGFSLFKMLDDLGSENEKFEKYI